MSAILTINDYRTDPQIAAEEYTKARLLKRAECWHEEPKIPESVEQAVKSYAERYGLRLSLVWNGWTGCWSVMSMERTLWSQGPFGVPEYRDVNTLLYVHADDETGEPLPLDNRLIEEIHARYAGETLQERMETKLRDRAEAKRKHDEHVRETMAAVCENIERDMKEVMKGKDPLEVVGDAKKIQIVRP